MQNHIKTILATTVFITIASIAAESSTPIEFQPGRQVGTVQTSLITEASGIIASRRNPPVLWVHNDSGNAANLYALNPEGKLLGIYIIRNAHNRDWEDIAIGPGPDPNRDYLYIGDIGDNSGKHRSITIYRVPEPKVDPNMTLSRMTTEPAESIELVYPDGPKDAETVIVDPLNGDIYIITKRQLLCNVYCAPYPQSTRNKITLRHVAVLPWTFAVGGDISPDGNYVIVRSYKYASMWERPKGKPLWEAFNQEPRNIELMSEPKGEAICFDAGGRGYFTISEMKNPPIYYFAAATAPKQQD